MFDAVEMTFQSVDVSRPEPAELCQPCIQLLKRFRLQTVETPLRVDRGLHKTGLPEHAQVLGYGRLRHAQLTLDLSHRLLRRSQQAQNGAAVRLGNDFKGGFHSLYIPNMAYTCQGI